MLVFLGDTSLLGRDDKEINQNVLASICIFIYSIQPHWFQTFDTK